MEIKNIQLMPAPRPSNDRQKAGSRLSQAEDSTPMTKSPQQKRKNENIVVPNV